MLRGFATINYQYSVRSVRLRDAPMPSTGEGCAGTPDTRRPNRQPRIAARAVPGR
jgi:hypothetical protein